MPQELPHNLDICGGVGGERGEGGGGGGGGGCAVWKSNQFFFFINFNYFLRNNMPQYNALTDHKIAFLLVQHQVFLYAAMQDNFQVD